MVEKRDIATETAIRVAIMGIFNTPPYNHRDAFGTENAFTTNEKYFTGDVQKGVYVQSSLLDGYQKRVDVVKKRLNMLVRAAREDNIRRLDQQLDSGQISPADHAEKRKNAAPKFKILPGRAHFSQIEMAASQEGWTQVKEAAEARYSFAYRPRPAVKDVPRATLAL